MIFDTIDNWPGHIGAKAVFDKIRHEVLPSLNRQTANGRFELMEGCYYKVMTYTTKEAPTIVEAHRKEVDLQIVLNGRERIKIYSKDQVAIKEAYDAETDCEFYRALGEPSSVLTMEAGKMALFFPQDIHACQYNVDNTSETIKKVVFKIDEKLFTQQE